MGVHRIWKIFNRIGTVVGVVAGIIAILISFNLYYQDRWITLQESVYIVVIAVGVFYVIKMIFWFFAWVVAGVVKDFDE